MDIHKFTPEEAREQLRLQVDKFLGNLSLRKPKELQSRAQLLRELYGWPKGTIVVDSAEGETFGAFASPWAEVIDNKVDSEEPN